MGPSSAAGSRRLVAAQLPGGPGKWEQRLAWADAALARASGAALVVLPESYLPGYLPGLRDPDAGARAEAWALQAARRSGAHIAMGIGGDDASELLLVAPEGVVGRYRKRFPTFLEAPHWRAGKAPGVLRCALGRVGLALCADVVQPGLWEAFAGRVDLVLVSAAWTDYGGRKQRLPGLRRRLLGPWMDGAGPHRDATLSAAAAALGVPVVFANATGAYRDGERFSGGSRVYGADGRALASVEADPALGDPEAGLAQAWTPLGGPSQGAAPTFAARWRLFALAHRLAARGRARLPSRA